MHTMGKNTVYNREEAFREIQVLREKYGEKTSNLSNANEAETRLLLIDEVLQLLGWKKDDFNPEEAVSGQSYIDYLLKIDNVPRLIVEAKKTDHTFSYQRKRTNKRTHYTINYLKGAFGQSFKEVLEQAQRYASNSGVPNALLSNGIEWMLVPLFRSPGFSSINELKGVYFGNLFSDDFSFDLFWTLLHKEQVREHSIESHMANTNDKEVDYCRVPQEQFGHLQWRTIQNEDQTRDFYRLFFDEIIDQSRRNMLEKCFVSDSQLDHYQGQLQRTLRDTAPNFLTDAVEIAPKERDKLLASDSGDQKGQVILIAGSVGCGKTTLIHKVLIEERQKKEKNVEILIVDLIDELGETQSDVKPQLWRHIQRTWKQIKPESYRYETLCKIFGWELSELKKGANAKIFEHDESAWLEAEAKHLDEMTQDYEQFFRSCWRYYRNKKTGVVVFFDNVDRASQEYQKQVYSFAHQLARATGATIILTMREFTFFRGQEAGFLDIRSSDIVFHLQSPNLQKVLSKRIHYIEDHLDNDHRLSSLKKRDDWSTQRANFLSYANALKQIFLKDRLGHDRLGVLESVSWHSVRFFLSTLQEVHAMLGSEDTPWQIIEILTSLMIPSSKRGGRSYLGNIYRPPHNNLQCYYLKTRILLFQTTQAQAKTRKGTSLERIISLMNIYGYSERVTKKAVEELVQERFLECLETPTEEDFTKNYVTGRMHSYRPSPLSIVLINRIISAPIYLCLIGNDLPFHNPLEIQKYERSLQTLYESIGDTYCLQREVVDLIPETDAGKTVARYLFEMYEIEQPPENLLNIPEIGATERKLSEIVSKLRDYADLQVPSATHFSPQRKLQTNEPQQISMLTSDFESITKDELAKIPVPSGIFEMRVNKSAQAPLIFWALVALKQCGQQYATGSEITQVINDQLMEDQHNKKAPNNISRALRSKTLRSQTWLLVKKVSPRKSIFGVTDDWKKYWKQMFEEPAPDLNSEGEIS